MPDVKLTTQEEQLFLTLRHEIMQTLGSRVDEMLKKSIISLRGEITKEKCNEVRKEIVDSLNSYGKKSLEI